MFLLFTASIAVNGCGSSRRIREKHPHPLEIGGVATEEELGDLHKFFYGAVEKYKGIDNYQCIFLKRQRIKGKLQEWNTISFKFKKPMSIYMKWLKEPYKGQEVLYAPSRYGKRGFGRAGGWLGRITPVIKIDVDGYFVMRDNIHPLDHIGIGYFLNLFMENFERADKKDEGALIDRGDGEESGRPVKLIECVLPPEKEKGYYCYRCILSIDKENKMPLRIKIYDWDNRLSEEYVYQDLELNPGLTDNDFDRNKKEYNF